MTPSWIQILVVVVLVLLFFGRGRVSSLMGDVAKGIRSFRDGMADPAPARLKKTKTPRKAKKRRS